MLWDTRWQPEGVVSGMKSWLMVREVPSTQTSPRVLRPVDKGFWTHFVVLAFEQEVVLPTALSGSLASSAFVACVSCVACSGLLATAGATVGVTARIVAGMATATMWMVG